MSNEWHETVRRIAFDNGIGESLLIAPPGRAESAQMRLRFKQLISFLDDVREAQESCEKAFEAGNE